LGQGKTGLMADRQDGTVPKWEDKGPRFVAIRERRFRTLLSGHFWEKENKVVSFLVHPLHCGGWFDINIEIEDSHCLSKLPAESSRRLVASKSVNL
jgi:hypothetical protein